MNIANNILKHSLKNVYFLVGTACGGKTTMARELSKKHGFIHYNDNWNEAHFKVWQSIINEKYQPHSANRKEIDWEIYFSRSVEEFLADKNDNHGSAEYLEFSIIELIKLSQNNKVVADVWIEDLDFLTEISDYGRIACLIAPGELIIRDYYKRDDHKDFTDCIKSLKNPESKFETQNELFRIGAKEFLNNAEKRNLFVIKRTEDSTVENTLAQLEQHFGLKSLNIEYTKDMSGITADMLTGFFAGWPNPPTAAAHLRILQNSYRSFVAIDRDAGKVVGFINAVSDEVLTAYIPLLEVVEDYQGKGIGNELVKRMLAEINNLYMVDICHDKELTSYYAKFGAYQSHSSIFRNYDAQSGLLV